MCTYRASLPPWALVTVLTLTGQHPGGRRDCGYPLAEAWGSAVPSPERARLRHSTGNCLSPPPSSC